MKLITYIKGGRQESNGVSSEEVPVGVDDNWEIGRERGKVVTIVKVFEISPITSFFRLPLTVDVLGV